LGERKNRVGVVVVGSFGSFRRGQTMLDALIVVIVLVVTAVIILFAYKILSDVNTSVQADSSFTNESKQSLADTTASFASTWDAIWLMAVVLFWVMLIVTSFFIDTNPIFFIISILLLLVTFVVSMVLANAYSDIAADPELSGFAVQFPIMSWMMNHLLVVVVVMALSAGLALYSKSRGGGL
jgi:hypothetical protein